MATFMTLVQQGITRFDLFAEDLDPFESMKVFPMVSSMAVAAVPEPLFVSGVVDNDDHNVIDFTVVGRSVSARSWYSPTDGPRTTVQSNQDIISIEITQAPITTSDVLGFRGSGSLEYVLMFGWGAVGVSKQMGSSEDRADWLRHFVTILGDRPTRVTS